MLQELKTLIATCDNCGYVQEYTSTNHQYPHSWGLATPQDYVGTRLDGETQALCPYCVQSVQNGFKKYAKSTLKTFPI